MALNGYVKLHRKLIEWGWYSDCVVKDVFLHILMVARFDDGQYLGREVKAGQAVIGRKAMAKDLGFSEQQIRTALKKLESTGEITLNSTNRFTIATVENWGFYQCDDESSNQQSTNNQPTDNQQITNNQPHLKNDKNDKNNIYMANSEDVEAKPKEKTAKRFKPPTVEEVKAYCLERKNNVNAEQFIDFYTANGWKVGKNSMKDWKASVRTWERNHKDDKPKQTEEIKPKRYKEFEKEEWERPDFKAEQMPDDIREKLGKVGKKI